MATDEQIEIACRAYWTRWHMVVLRTTQTPSAIYAWDEMPELIREACRECMQAALQAVGERRAP